MKRIITLLTAVIMILSLAACGSQNTAAPETAQNQSQAESTVTAEPASTDDQISEPQSGAETPEPQEDSNESGEKKALIVYFSPANSDTIDAVSSATPRVGEVSSVEYVAQLIDAKVDADMSKIMPAEAYPLVYDDAADQAKQERDKGERPAFTLDVNPEDYDTIFIGYPMWWYEMPMIMDTFFDTYDFSGKTIIPFNTHAGSRDGGTYKDIAELEPNATVLEGLAVSGERAGNAENDVNKWLSDLGF